MNDIAMKKPFWSYFGFHPNGFSHAPMAEKNLTQNGFRERASQSEQLLRN